MDLTIEQALCILETGWKDEDEKNLYDLAKGLIHRESRKLFLKYKLEKAQKELKELE